MKSLDLKLQKEIRGTSLKRETFQQDMRVTIGLLSSLLEMSKGEPVKFQEMIESLKPSMTLEQLLTAQKGLEAIIQAKKLK